MDDKYLNNTGSIIGIGVALFISFLHVNARAEDYVMIVDDSVVNVKILQKKLQGFKQLIAYDGQQAVDLLNQLQHEEKGKAPEGLKPGDRVVILMDKTMPTKDGLEATREIRALHNGIKCYIIGYSNEATSPKMFEEAGAHTSLIKPSDSPRVPSAIKKGFAYLDSLPAGDRETRAAGDREARVAGDRNTRATDESKSESKAAGDRDPRAARDRESRDAVIQIQNSLHSLDARNQDLQQKHTLRMDKPHPSSLSSAPGSGQPTDHGTEAAGEAH